MDGTGFGGIVGTKGGGGDISTAEVLSKSGGTLKERGLVIGWISPAGKKVDWTALALMKGCPKLEIEMVVMKQCNR